MLEGAEDWCTETLVAYTMRTLHDRVNHLVWEYDGIGLNETALADRATFLTDAEN